MVSRNYSRVRRSFCWFGTSRNRTRDEHFVCANCASTVSKYVLYCCTVPRVSHCILFARDLGSLANTMQCGGTKVLSSQFCRYSHLHNMFRTVRVDKTIEKKKVSQLEKFGRVNPIF